MGSGQPSQQVSSIPRPIRIKPDSTDLAALALLARWFDLLPQLAAADTLSNAESSNRKVLCSLSRVRLSISHFDGILVVAFSDRWNNLAVRPDVFSRESVCLEELWYPDETSLSLRDTLDWYLF
jgi:hypothetical protein